MLYAFLHPWGKRTLHRIGDLNLQSHLLVETVIVAGETGFLPIELGRCSCMLPAVSRAGGIVLMSLCERLSSSLLACLSANRYSHATVAAHSRHMHLLLTLALASSCTTLSMLPPPGNDALAALQATPDRQ